MRAANPCAMRHLDRYTPEICSQLRQIAENRQWKSWNTWDFTRDDLLEELELTYHLHTAAEATGERAGMAPMPPFPISFSDPEGRLDPELFIKAYSRGQSVRNPWNQSDSDSQTEWFTTLSGALSACAMHH